MGRYDKLFLRLSSKDFSDTSVHNPILNRQSCHHFVTQKCLNCGKEWVANLPCSDKLCVECNAKRSYKHRYTIFALLNVLGLINRANRLRFVTLTIKNVSSVAEGYAKLRRCFSILQHKAVWNKSFYGRKNHLKRGWCVRGGLGNFETTNRLQGKGYHVHLHLLVDSAFIPQDELSKVWRAITGDSFVVDVRACSGTKDALYEVSKYSFKPADAVLWSDDMRVDFNVALKNKVLFFRFGCWRDVVFDRLSARCSNCGSEVIITLDFEEQDIIGVVKNPILLYGQSADYG